MTTILGTLTDSTGNPVSGNLNFNLLQSVTDETTNPDTVRFPISKVYAITAGVVNINIPESETYGVPYNIKFIPTGATTPVLDFASIVPNVGTVQFGSLVPTGITNASLDTGALRVAQLLTTDPVLAPLVKRPYVQSFNTFDQPTSRTWFISKSWDTGSLIQSVDVIVISGTGWTFTSGFVNSAGNDTQFSVSNTSTVPLGGRTYIKQTINITTPSTTRAFYIRATAGTGATILTASLSMKLIETSS